MAPKKKTPAPARREPKLVPRSPREHRMVDAEKLRQDARRKPPRSR